MEDPNDDNTALDKQSVFPKGVPLGIQSNTKDLEKTLALIQHIKKRTNLSQQNFFYD